MRPQHRALTLATIVLALKGAVALLAVAAIVNSNTVAAVLAGLFLILSIVLQEHFRRTGQARASHTREEEHAAEANLRHLERDSALANEREQEISRLATRVEQLIGLLETARQPRPSRRTDR